LPVIALITFSTAGISLVSEALAVVNPITHLVEIKDPDGKVIQTLSATTAWPVCGVISLEFGVEHLPYQPYHTGLDIANDFRVIGSPVTPFMEGTVTRVIDSTSGFGKHVIIDHGNGISSLYGHLSELRAVEGRHVSPGDVIGLEGNTGASTGPHLHFTIMISSIPINPHIFMIGEPERCIR
jgi:murein DD-endopeptidase MepM/ murein hydrolase activator NlpD